MPEEWKRIEEFPKYEVSSEGKIRNKHGNLVGGTLRTDGYTSLTLCNSGTYKRRLLHRLIALAFIPNPDNKDFIDHINQDKSDNSISNLRWATHSENMLNRKKDHPDYITEVVRWRVSVPGHKEKRFLKKEDAEKYRDELLAKVKFASVECSRPIIQE